MHVLATKVAPSPSVFSGSLSQFRLHSELITQLFSL